MEDSENPCAVVALGGNALSPPSQSVTVQEQFRHTRQSLRGLISLLKENYEIAVVHGNGPQVGVALLRVELSKDVLPDIPLGMLVADTEGSIGYMIEQSFQNLLTKENIDRSVATLITQVIVDENDPSLKTPTKFIGRIYSHTEAQQKMKKNKWEMLKFNEKGNWRRVVGSPKPLEIVNSTTLKTMVKSGTITIVAGGGGIPVYNHPEYGLDGIDAVIDKDLAAALVGQVIKAQMFLILTNIDGVYKDFGKPNAQLMKILSTSEAKVLMDQGYFPEGSMRPKIESALQFIENGGEKTIICSLEHISDALAGKSGTTITL